MLSLKKNETIINFSDLAKAINNYLAEVAVDIQSFIQFSKKK